MATLFALCHKLQTQVIEVLSLKMETRNNQRLRSVGDNDRRSKRFCSSSVLCVSFA